MKVLVNGIGNIGTTILNLLVDYKKLLGISEIYALKNTQITTWNKVELNIIAEKGVILCSKTNTDFIPLPQIINTIDYIFDCNANTFGLKNKGWYANLPQLKGCSAQGSEKGFGLPFMSGINNEVIKSQKFVQIVSCNTHALSALIMAFSGKQIENLLDGDFVIVRRSEDLGNHQRLVAANVVSRHLDKTIGTHHAIDVKDLFATKNILLPIESSDITTPSQLMHTVRFNFRLRKLLPKGQIEKQLDKNGFISRTSKFDSNIIFELGRKYSAYGRLFSHAIINDNNLLINTKTNTVKGWAFIPQEGNTILSTIHAFVLQMSPEKEKEVMAILQADLIREFW